MFFGWCHVYRASFTKLYWSLNSTSPIRQHPRSRSAMTHRRTKRFHRSCLCNSLYEMLDQKRLTKDGFRLFNTTERTGSDDSPILKELSYEQALNYSHEYDFHNYSFPPVFIEYNTTYSVWYDMKCAQIVPIVKTESNFWKRVLDVTISPSEKYNFTQYYYALNFKRTLNQMRSDFHSYYRGISPIHSHLQYRYTVYKTVKPSTLIHPCIEYSEEKHFKSRSYCLRQCEMIKSMEKCSKKYGPGFALNCSHQEHRFHYRDLSPPRMFPNIKNCQDCPQDCTNLIYVFMEPIKRYTKDLIRISMFGTDPVIDILFSVKLSLIEYVIFIASCISLWFGFSMFQSLFYVDKLIKKYYERKNKRIIAPTVNNTNTLNLTLVYEPFLANRYRTMTNFNH